jgi:hypothetical protein
MAPELAPDMTWLSKLHAMCGAFSKPSKDDLCGQYGFTKAVRLLLGPDILASFSH